jgi:DNA-binding MarR family transcriptional regulator
MAYWKSKQGEREAINRLIYQNPGISPAEIARRLGVSRSTVLRQLPSLEEAGYLYSEDGKGRLHYYKRRR